jgi:hypothetical protein
MGISRPVIAAVALTAVAVALALIFGGKDSKTAKAETSASPGQPAVSIISPRNGARQGAHAVVVKVAVENFELAPSHFGGEPELNQGNLRFSLNRVPDCVDPVKLERAINSPIGKGRLKGRSFDYARYAGPNGVLAERLGTEGSYSPATRPEIFYRNLDPGFYRLIVSLAQNNGEALPPHDVTTFQVLPRPGHGPKPCPKGKVSSADAAAGTR